ncbi:MAG TPA: hypothetical protein VFM18_14360, partial [Methanosarcina sp.]|nr:hypothetical protein [Methanosarcina sp.]
RTSSVLRAIVDTTPKESKASDWTTYSAVSANAALVVSVDYECDTDLNLQIRDTYPDVIAGDWGIFNPTQVTIYVQRESTGEIRKFTGFIPAGENLSQDFIITDWTSGTVVGSVPSTSASFFDPSTNSFSTTASAGNLVADNYRVCHTYVWNGDTVSDISHNVAEGCIAESQVNGEQVFGITTYNTIEQIKAEDNLYDGLQLYCKNTQQLYVYNENSNLIPDDNLVLLPDGEVGRWVSTIIGVKDTLAQVAITGDYDDLINKPTLGTASTLNVGTSVNNVVQLDSEAKLPAVDGSQLIGLPTGIPDQTDNAGKYLTTDGEIAAWANIDALPSQTGQGGKYLKTNGTVAAWSPINELEAVVTRT